MGLSHLSVSVPTPSESQRPTRFADEVGRWYTALADQGTRRALGQVFTPVAVAEFMAQHAASVSGRTVRILDPGSGAGVLTCAVAEALARESTRPKRIEVVAFECGQLLADALESVLGHLKAWLAARHGVDLGYEVRRGDFVLEEGSAVSHSGALFGKPDDQFDIAILNPPYFKLGKSDPRSLATVHIVHGQPNIYALFLATAASLLRNGGRLTCITPRSFASGPYFRAFRQWFFRRMLLNSVHVFGSRRKAFERDGVLQENVILSATRRDLSCDHGSALVSISSSMGIHDLASASIRKVSLGSILDRRDDTLRIPGVDGEGAARWAPKSLEELGLAVSTGPVVAFRAAAALCGAPGCHARVAPLLWMQNVRAMQVSWPVRARAKAQYITVSPETRSLLLPNRSYVLVRRFTAKEERRRLVAAPLVAGALGSDWVGLENHLNYVYRPGGSLTEEEAVGLAVLLNSSPLENHLRAISGSTQVNASDLRKIPLPRLEDIRAVGRRAHGRTGPLDPAADADAIVEEILG
jgi:adenine-specific DNA-methyltransferase